MSDENVVRQDFGKEHNESVRSFARLMGMAVEQEEKMRADPVPFIREAHKEIAHLRSEMQKAREALYVPMVLDRRPVSSSAEISIVRVDRRRHEALMRCEAIVMGWDKT